MRERSEHDRVHRPLDAKRAQRAVRACPKGAPVAAGRERAPLLVETPEFIGVATLHQSLSTPGTSEWKRRKDICRRASMRTLSGPPSWARCMLGSVQFGCCNLSGGLRVAVSDDPVTDQRYKRSRPDWAVDVRSVVTVRRA